MGDLRSEVESLAHLERLKTQAIAARDIDALTELSQREAEATANMHDLELRRTSLVRALAGAHIEEPTVEEVAATLGGAYAEALRDSGQQLRSSIDDLRRVTSRNASLLNWAAEMARATAQWLLGYGQTTPVYNRLGDHQLEPAVPARRWNA
jgi:hypothetical protein